MPENNRRYTDSGMEPDSAREALGALKRKLTEGEAFIPRGTDSAKFNGQIEDASKEFELKAKSAIEPIKPQDSPMILLSKSPHSPEHKKYIENVVSAALPKVRTSFKNAKIVLPTDDEILQQMIMTNRFNSEQIEALIRNIQTPGLIILPPQMKGFGDYESLLNANRKRGGQRDVFVSESRRTAFAAQDKKLQEAPASYRFGIGEMSQELKDRSGKLRNIVAEWQGENLAKILRVPTSREYAVLQGQAPDLLDLRGWSILCEETKPHNIIGDDNLVSGGSGCNSWSDGVRVYFSGYGPERDFDYARVRPVVVK